MSTGYANVRRAPVFARRRLEHNNAKRVLIDWAVWWVRATVVRDRGVDVLDIAAGKGQDLSKWVKHGCVLRSFRGSDVCAGAVSEARRRLQHERVPAYAWSYHVHDGASHALPHSADIVSMQLALHYFCDEEASLCRLLHHVSLALRPGGVFIGTTVHEDALAVPRDAPAFGHGYVFELPGRIDAATEYRVPRHEVRYIAQTCNMHLCFWRTMHCYLHGARQPSTDPSNHQYVVFAFIKQ